MAWGPVRLTGMVGMVLAIALVTPRSVGAATRFVATTGNDSSNTCLASSTPCKTITRALTQAVANDTISVAAGTLGNDGIVHLASVGVFVVATVNLGAPGLLTVTADTGGVTLPVTITVCETDPASLCLAPPAPAVQTQVASGATPTFGVFVGSDVPIPFDPANHRIQVHLEGGGGGGGTSVAACTQPLCP